MILDDIIALTRDELRIRKQKLPEKLLLDNINRHGQPRSLSGRLTAPLPPHARAHIIAEIKKASPSCGCIREDFDPIEIAQLYERNGAAALSVLTEEQYFQGSLQILEQVRSVTTLPLLRKDFLIDPYQIVESRYFGADAVLLIVRALSNDLLADLLSHTHAHGMEALVEVHNGQELKQAMAVGAKLIGINNRDLSTFRTDLATSERLAALVDRDVVLVSESGIHTAEDIQRLTACGIKAFLVGETLMRAPSPGQKLRELLQW